MKRIFYPGCGGEHDDEAISGKFCSKQRVAVKGNGRRQGMRVLGILAGLVAVMGLIACGDTVQQKQARQEAARQEQARQEQARQELQEAIAAVLKGQGVPQAAAYGKDGPGPHRLVLVTGSGKPHEWTSSLPAEWIAKTVSEMALIVVVIDKEVALASQEYVVAPNIWTQTSASPITRYRHDLRVDVREAQTGVLLDHFTVEGEERDFPKTAPVNQTRIDGSGVEPAQFAEVLCGHFKLVRPNTGGPTGRSETNPIGMKFLKLGSGSFLMGSVAGSGHAWPVHHVTISRAFYLQTTEVTQGQWRAVMGDNPSHFKNGDNYPVESVRWDNVQTFLERLNRLDPGKNYRLPTEAEWEYACRAGTTGARYGELDAIAWYRNNSGDQTHPVGKKQPNTWELYDMLGNEGEWCADWHGEEYYANSPATDPRGPSSGGYRVKRGGSWGNYGDDVRSADRSLVQPGLWSIDHGFRCARD